MSAIYKEIWGPSWLHSLPESMQQDLLAGKSIILGGKIYQVCYDCRKVVCANKTFFGSMHYC